MFENIFNQNNPIKAEQESDRRHINLAREQTAIQASTNDAIYAEEQREKSDLIRWQQELNEELEILKHDLMNEYVNEDGIYVTKGEPFVTEGGLHMIETELRPLLSKNLINSNLSEIMILLMLRNTADTIVDNLSDNFDIYITRPSPSTMSHILRLTKNAMIPTPFRALGGWTKRMDISGIKRIETYADNAQKEKKFFGLI